MKFGIVDSISNGYRVVTYRDEYGSDPSVSAPDFDDMAEALEHIHGVQMEEGTNLAIWWRNLDGELRSRAGTVGKGRRFQDAPA
jgi:hypothetical protein